MARERIKTVTHWPDVCGGGCAIQYAMREEGAWKPHRILKRCLGHAQLRTAQALHDATMREGSAFTDAAVQIFFSGAKLVRWSMNEDRDVCVWVSGATPQLREALSRIEGLVPAFED